MAKFTFDGLFNGQCGTGNATVYDDAGGELKLAGEQQLGRTGAGGTVYGIDGHPEFCIKLFKSQDLADDAKREGILRRLEAALEHTECQRDPRFAWPLGAVKDADGHVIGYAMRRIPAGFKPFRSLFGGADAVRRCFPRWTRKELATAARTFVDAVAWLERNGVRVADFNPENFAVAEDGRVMFLDCDSFMMSGQNGKVHASAMYYPDCAAPEILMNPGKAGEARTEEQTRFSAAVVAFMLLMEGQHPFTFAGTALDGTTVGAPEDNILAGKCPLGKDAGCMQAPEWYRLWSWLTGGLKVAFIKTFKDGHGVPAARVPLEELSKALGQFVFECGRMPERNNLAPAVAKPSSEQGGYWPAGGWQRPLQPVATWGGARRPGRAAGGYRPFGSAAV